MTNKAVREYELNQAELDSLNTISQEALPLFSDFAGTFLHRCVKAGFKSRVAGASLSLFTITNIVRAVLMCSGMEAEDVNTETVDKIADNIHKELAEQVGAYVTRENIKHDPSRN